MCCRRVLEQCGTDLTFKHLSAFTFKSWGVRLSGKKGTESDSRSIFELERHLALRTVVPFALVVLARNLMDWLCVAAASSESFH